ncbi:MAG: class I SAM-dependent methyltransferase [Sphingomonadaceae bacterium]|nr:class I SAM-dependent methyltransferase [Sphingomonadaceae bacterium]
MLTVRIEALNLASGDQFLDIGCGEGRHCHAVQMLTQAQAIGVDLDEPSLELARQRAQEVDSNGPLAQFQSADASALPFADGSFDAAICSEVLEHVPDTASLIAEAARVLRPGAIFAVTVPRVWPERICWKLASGPGGYSDQPGGHIRIVDPKTLCKEIEGQGFRFMSSHHAHALHTPYWWLKTAFWSRRDDHPLVRAWHRLLVWDMMEKPALTRVLERLLNPLMGKSVAMYFERL